MYLDTLVKLSQIATPFILIFLGYFVSKSVNRYIQNYKIASEFNTKWSDRFIDKCISYSEIVSQFTSAFFKSANFKEHEDDGLEKIKNMVHDIRDAKYDVKIHSKLVDDADDVSKTIDQIHDKVAQFYKNKGGNIDEITELQMRLNKQLRVLQKLVLKLD